ncbi:hypothetical protein [Clostridium sp. HCS.1]|uniref:hypothetical protein n=1 Tax=Clostridium sp. HCS.1 TaxID=3238594 RepID=UPI003A0FE301
MNKINNKYVIIVVILSLILLNLFQLIKLKNYQSITDNVDSDFGASLDLICIGIETIEDNTEDEFVGIAILASGTGEAESLYKQSSYYKENELLYVALRNLNTIISNNSRVRELIEKNDLKTLIPIIEDLRKNPLDNEATEKLHVFFRYFEM